MLISSTAAAPLAAHFVIGFASAAYLPGLFGYVSSIKQATAAAAAASINLAMFSAAGVLIIEEADTPLIKNRPKRSVIVLASVLGAFLFSVLGALVADAYRDIDWKSITRKEA